MVGVTLNTGIFLFGLMTLQPNPKSNLAKQIYTWIGFAACVYMSPIFSNNFAGACRCTLYKGKGVHYAIEEKIWYLVSTIDYM